MLGRDRHPGLLGHLAATGGLGKIASLTLMVCALDNAEAGTVIALASRDLAAAAVAESARKGYLDGQALAGVFTWLRPNDLVWSYVVNNYLLGKAPPAFDILYWNQDTVRMSAGLHRDFIHIGLENSFTQPGRARGAGLPGRHLRRRPRHYAIAGLSDHIVPWENAYRRPSCSAARGGSSSRAAATSRRWSTRLDSRSAVRASYRVADDLSRRRREFLEHTPKHAGSWWPDWDAWLAERSGDAARRADITGKPTFTRPGQGTG